MKNSDDNQKEIGDSISQIEQNIKKSFAAVRKEIEYLKSSPKPLTDAKLIHEVDTLGELVRNHSQTLDSLKNTIQDFSSSKLKKINEKESSEMQKIAKEISSVRSGLDRSSILKQKDLEEIRKVTYDLELKLNKELETIKSSLSDLKISEETTKKWDSSLLLVKESLLKDISQVKKDTLAENNRLLEQSKKELSAVKSNISAVKREIANHNTSFEEKLSQKDSQIDTLQKQIDYLKGRISRISKESPLEKEEIKKIKKSTSFKFNFIPLIRIIIIVLVLFLIGYLLYANIFSHQKFNYFYDIGSSVDAASPFLSPLSRVSLVSNETQDNQTISYRSITSDLVYFSVPIPAGSDSVHALVRFKDVFEDDTIYLGARDKEVWSYSLMALYNPELEHLTKYHYSGEQLKIFQVNPSAEKINLVSQIPQGSIVATDTSLKSPLNTQSFDINPMHVNTTIKGEHTFYIYLKDSLRLTVEKQDLNLQNGTDELKVTFSDINGKEISNLTIADDGIDYTNNLITANIQNGTISLANLKEGVYVLKFSSFDGLIRSFFLNTDKIVSRQIFLAGSDVYLPGLQMPSSLYYKSNKESFIDLKALHTESFQDIKINDDTVPVKSLDNVRYYGDENSYSLQVTLNDIIVSSPGYLSFSEQNWFEPFLYSVVPLTAGSDKLDSVDYIITSYQPVQREGDWLVSSAYFDLSTLYLQDGSLNFVISSLALANNQTDLELPIDWINVSVIKN